MIAPTAPHETTTAPVDEPGRGRTATFDTEQLAEGAGTKIGQSFPSKRSGHNYR